MSGSAYNSDLEWSYGRSSRRRGWLTFRRVLILGALGLTAGLLSSLWVGSTFVASANRDIGNPPKSIPFNEFTVPSDSGTELAAWHAVNEDSTATVVLLHPLRGSRNSMINRAEFLFKAGYSVMLIDFQAHGESMGDTITFGHLERFDVRAAVEDVRRKYPDQKIVVLGNSLGGAAALLASPLDVDAMIIEAVYPRIEKAIENRVARKVGPLSSVLSPLLTVQIEPRLGIALSELQPIDKVCDADCPLLLFVGQNDEHTTIQDSEDLFNSAEEPKQMEVFPKAKHVDLHRYDSDLYEKKVLEFLQQHLDASDVSSVASSDLGE